MLHCYRCMKNEVDAYLGLCAKCLKIDYKRHWRHEQGRPSQTSEDTHRRNRAEIEQADKTDYGRRGNYPSAD
jgi:hypothetical protein